MATRTLADVSQTDFEASKLTSKELLVTAHPALDLRDGTALADLLVGPGAELTAYNNLNIADLRANFSFKLMQDNPEAADPDMMDLLAANYNLARRTGAKASGSAVVMLSSSQQYSVSAGYPLAIGTQQYVTLVSWTLVPVTPSDLSSQLQIKTNAQGEWYVILPMEASVAGSTYNYPEGTAMTMVQSGIPNMVSASVYQAFGGGTDTETNTQFMLRIPVGMSQSEFSGGASIATRLYNQFSVISNISVIGMGDPEMLRDKHNVFGIAVGGRVDVYLKNFIQPSSVVILKTATRISNGVYGFTLLPEDSPGYYCIRSITSPGSTLTAETDFTIPALGSLPFTETRFAYGSAATFHDFGSTEVQNTRDTAYSLWQKADLVVTDVPATLVGGVSSYPDTLQLKVELYAPAMLTDIQGYIDGRPVRNKASDTVARCAMLCFVSLSATIYRKSTASVDMAALRQAVADYINNKNFGDVLTDSQLMSVFHRYDIVRAQIDNSEQGLKLQADVRGADGLWRRMQGATLDVDSVGDSAAMLSSSTALFVADPRSIFITERIE